MKKFNESLAKLEQEITTTGNMTSKALRERAKIIAGIGVDHFAGELLRRCLAISAAIVDFAKKLDDPK